MTESTNETGTHTAGLFDIRIIIAALMGIYGVILVLTAFFTSDAQLDRADGLNVNLVGGIGMIVLAVLFTVWARLRPTVVPDHVEHDDDRPAGH
jgi:hypothetical protein